MWEKFNHMLQRVRMVLRLNILVDWHLKQKTEMILQLALLQQKWLLMQVAMSALEP